MVNSGITLNAPDIKECRENLSKLTIAPFDNKRAKGIGYNLSASDLIYSLRKKTLLPIHYNDDGSYIYIRPHDTVLVLSYEYVEARENVCGTFHSRVRNVASGLGNVSTTLDPGWKGMLLISLNNPTNKKIKLQITQNKDGKKERCSLLTLVVHCQVKSSEDNKEMSFHLDNPPMRADIWNELIAKPHRFFNNKKYHKFQMLIEKMVGFEPVKNDRMRYFQELLDVVLKIEIEAEVNKCFKALKSLMIELKQKTSDDYIYLKDKILSLCEYIEMRNEIDLVSLEVLYELKVKVENIRRECKYLMLCEEVDQIHKFIHDNIDKWWESGGLLRIKNDYLIHIIISVFSSAILLMLFLFLPSLGDNNIYYKIIISMIPAVCTFILGFVSKLLKGIERKE